MNEFAFESLTLDRTGQIIARTPGSAQCIREDLGGGLALEMLRIPAGLFQMGSPRYLGYPDEHPIHPVSVPAFWLGRTLVTQAQWRALGCKKLPFRFHGDLRPVEQVSRLDAQEFCRRLSRRSGRTYRLPSEAEWECACRAGTAAPFSCGETLTTDMANYVGEHTYADEPKGVYRHGTTDVASFPPNPFGLADMHGNLWEWCADAWCDDYVGASASAAPRDSREGQGSDTPGGHAWGVAPLWGVARGGSWHETPNHCRSAVRLRFAASEHEDYIGFRVALDLYDLPHIEK